MRLIDADKLKYAHYVQRSDTPIGYEGTQPIYEYASYVDNAVSNAPTVKAIPIEWIKKWLETCIPRYDYDRMTYIADVYEMLEDWEKENESRDTESTK